MCANSTLSLSSSTSKTPLDYIAEGYWQDFLAGRSIAGGMAYEAQLQACQLDESLASLQRIDTLITQIRRDLIKSNSLNETVLLADEPYRNLLIFLAFYAGRVLAQQWQSLAHWYGHFELQRHYPDLVLATDDFYQHMAVLYHDDHKQVSFNKSGMNQSSINKSVHAELFFALEPIGLRLFGHIDRQFKAIQGGQVASGLYQAVSARAPNMVTAATLTAVKSDNISAPEQSTHIKENSIAPSSVQTELAKISALLDEADLSAKHTAKEPNTVQSVAVASTIIDPVTENLAIYDSATTRPSAESVKTAKPDKPILPTPEIFTQLLAELNTIEVVQTYGNDDYQQACKILDHFEDNIANQRQSRAQIVLTGIAQAKHQQALILLKNAASAGNTAAMLRLAMYELLGEGLTTDKTTSEKVGVDWVKQAANAKDVRAQRLLSKMYYQGVGVSPDITNGKLWLEQAAANGHQEAANIVAQWQQAQRLITTQKQEQNSVKRYQLLIAVVIVASLLLIVFIQ